ncbi:anaphase-promoting complex subunit 1-like [Lineus longissimus]|uniref:anaphase-promoting complex subunit 1-like n=1 Tax=Lineus longissimus TaxID=88925 RepID=UPI00315CF20D
MIITCDTQDFVPFGREHHVHHPGLVELQVQNRSAAECWKLQSCTGEKCEPCDEELYIKDDTVIWSRGSVGSSRTIIKSFSMDSKIREVMWCSFVLPKGQEDGEEGIVDDDIDGEVQHGICIQLDNCLHVFVNSGKEYIAALPFQVARVWEMKNGLLLERAPTQAEVVASKRQLAVELEFGSKDCLIVKAGWSFH